MAIYHCSIKKVQRSKGRSSVAAAAYRAREQIVDERQGLTFDYSEKDDLVHAEIIGYEGSRSELWNAAEAAEKRKDSVTAVEYEVAIPRELTPDQRVELVREYATWLNDRHGVAVDFAIHTDDDDYNPHAHILTTTRAPHGRDLAGQKVARDWSDTKRKKHGLPAGRDEVKSIREQWATVANKHLERAQQHERIDHRSHADRGIELKPSIKLGHAVLGQEQKGIRTDRGNHATTIMQINYQIHKAQALTLEIQHERGTNKLRQNEHDRATPQSAELRRDGRQNGTVRPEYGDTDRPVQPRPDGQSQGTARTGGNDKGTIPPNGANPERHHGGQHGANSQHGKGRGQGYGQGERATAIIRKMVENVHGVANRFSSGFSRIMELAAPYRAAADTPSMGGANRPRMENSGQRPTQTNKPDNGLENRGMKPDPTYRAVKRQIEKMGCDSYQIGVIGATKDNGMAMHKTMSKAEVLKEIPNLKRLNAQGNHIFIQPAEKEHNLILVDDVGFDDIEKMRSNGHEAAVVVETSPDNYQAWVKAPNSLTEDERAVFAKGLAEKYDADPNSAQKRHYGRLAGFTNQKPEHQNSRGHHPFALLRESTGQVATGLDKAVAMVKQQTREWQQKHNHQTNYLKNAHSGRINPKWARMFNSEISSLQSHYGEKYNPSVGDWMAIKKCLGRGCDKETAAKVLVRNSPNIEERKRTVNVEQYVNLTVAKAAKAVEQSPDYRVKQVKETPSQSRGPDFSR